MKIRWRYGLIAALFLAVFSLYPQMKMFYLRGSEWNGNYAYNDIDEVAYASYVRALIDGRPRKNDPYTGKDDSPESPQPESLFSIQFAAPYSIALPARLLGIGAPWAMTISGAVAAFLTALAIFWLLRMTAEDDLFAMAGTLVVLAGGAIFAGEGAIGEILRTSYAYPYFPGFRRYIPAMAFPAFFMFVAVIWQMLRDQNKHLPRIVVALACFAYFAFSYFYVWTAAVAWLGIAGLLWLGLRPEGWVSALKRLLILGAGCIMVLVPYAYLLSKRSHTMDDVQMLVRTHSPDLMRVPEFIGIFVVIVTLSAGVLRIVPLRERLTLFTLSLALTPLIVFNQQILTGLQLQPIHYQVFIGNYVAGLSLVMMVGLIWNTAASRIVAVRRALAAAAALAAIAWGFVECHYTVKILDDVNVDRDEAFPVAARLNELSKGADWHRDVVMHFGMAEADDLPTLAPQPVLWARHQHVFAGVTWQENKERYYQYLYYLGVRPESLAHGMKNGTDLVSVIALFGWGRHTDRLNSEYKPLTYGEIDAEAGLYAKYIASFDPHNALPLTYAITEVNSMQDLENIDKWYDRDAGETFGRYTLYKLDLR
ncbi:MAG: hypothetical protein HS105_02910 [Chloracidobacterium sp.]|nr:hypothetical protein [Chloracidobacterium sp.]MCO5333464.1 hypothetical protein [Pyrinomonadaceae bacterium]